MTIHTCFRANYTLNDQALSFNWYECIGIGRIFDLNHYNRQAKANDTRVFALVKSLTRLSASEGRVILYIFLRTLSKLESTFPGEAHCTKNLIYTKFTQCKFRAKKCKLRLNIRQRW